MTLSDLFTLLSPYSPALVGTFPLGIQVEGSDLDIVCHAPRLDEFESHLSTALEGFPGFSVRRESTTPPSILAQGKVSGLPVEIFGQEVPVSRQNAFRHMLVEGRLLSLGGSSLRDAVIQLKRQGRKTEPAFAEVLGLSGDPYEAILALESRSDQELALLV